MATHSSTDELVAALYAADGKAEIVGGELILMSPAGDRHNRAGGNIYLSLRQYERTATRGRAFTDNAGFLVELENRKSFSPDVAFHLGPATGAKFLSGAPVFAVEVRSEDDYGAAAERDLAAKRADYFAAGTRVVWDVDALREPAIRVYAAETPDAPRVYRKSETAEAEPALPGWTFRVDDLLE